MYHCSAFVSLSLTQSHLCFVSFFYSYCSIFQTTTTTRMTMNKAVVEVHGWMSHTHTGQSFCAVSKCACVKDYPKTKKKHTHQISSTTSLHISPNAITFIIGVSLYHTNDSRVHGIRRQSKGGIRSNCCDEAHSRLSSVMSLCIVSNYRYGMLPSQLNTCIFFVTWYIRLNRSAPRRFRCIASFHERKGQTIFHFGTDDARRGL